MLRRNYQTLREATINLNNSLKDNDGRPLDRATNGAKDPDKAIESKGSGDSGGGKESKELDESSRVQSGTNEQSGDNRVADVEEEGGDNRGEADRAAKPPDALILNEEQKKRNLHNVKSQALAGLVIRKNMLGKVAQGPLQGLQGRLGAQQPAIQMAAAAAPASARGTLNGEANVEGNEIVVGGKKQT